MIPKKDDKEKKKTNPNEMVNSHNTPGHGETEKN
jgi:hypothetical protein